VSESNKLNFKQKITSPITLASLIITLIAIGISGFILYGQWVTNEEQSRLNNLVDTEARKRAAAITQYVKEQQQQVELFASRPSFLTLAQNSSQSLVSAANSSLKAAYHDAIAMRLFTLDRVDRINREAEPLSFTELDMLNRAEQNNIVPPELVTGGESKILLIRPITDKENNEVIGTLLLSIPSAGLFKRIAQVGLESGHTELLRQAVTKPISLYKTSTLNSTPSSDIAVTNTVWLVRFYPSAALIQQAQVSAIPVIALHILLAIILLPIIYFLLGKIDPSRKPKPQQVTATSAIIKTGKTTRHDVLDVQITEEDSGVLNLQETEILSADVNTSKPESLPDNIFRAYDIRGIAHTEITPDVAMKIGQAVASEALAAGEDCLFVGRDGRTHSPELCQSLIEGVLSTGCNVINLGLVPTPLVYFATCEFPESNSGIIVTASHNTAEYNGFKMVINGDTLSDNQVLQIKSRIQRGDFYQGDGEASEKEVIPEYIERIFSDVALAGDVKIVIDASNGAASKIAPRLFEELGCDVVPLFCEVDGNFPNHNPDPTREENLQALIAEVIKTNSDLGVALDGDADRLVVVTQTGQIIWPDRLLMLFAKDIVSRHPGSDVLYDVKCTRELSNIVRSYGGRPIMWKTGHSHLKAKMKQTGALIGGELSGHIFIKDRWYGFDDGMYATARLLEIMTLRDQDADSLFASFPTLPSTPEILVPIDESKKFQIVEKLIANGEFQNGKATTIDGLRVDFTKGWGLVRASNTTAALTMRFEAEEQKIIDQIQQLFKRELEKIDPTIQLPF
jgi:phosphomannomutase/phosphoglucomutase